MNKRGVTLIEVLLSIVIIAIASIATLTYFSHAKGGIGKTGNRRAALERARERLEQLMASPITPITPPVNDGSAHQATCSAGSCILLAPVTEFVSVDDLPAQKIESTVQWVDDPSAGTTGPSGTIIYDALALDVKVWFTSDFGVDDDFNRVNIRTLRTR